MSKRVAVSFRRRGDFCDGARSHCVDRTVTDRTNEFHIRMCVKLVPVSDMLKLIAPKASHSADLYLQPLRDVWKDRHYACMAERVQYACRKYGGVVPRAHSICSGRRDLKGRFTGDVRYWTFVRKPTLGPDAEGIRR